MSLPINQSRRDLLDKVISTTLSIGLSSHSSYLIAESKIPAWPVKPIHIIVPNPAGGTADILTRLIAEGLTQKLGQPIIIENKPGAAGNIGAEYVFNSDPDGYTLMSAPPPALAINVSLYPKLAYDSAKFTAITELAHVPNALIINPSLPFGTLKEFIAYAKANPSRLTYASQGNGSTSHLTAELFKQKTGIELIHIPYKGDAPAIADLLAGHVDLMFGNMTEASNYISSGKLKVLAVTSSKRLKGFPSIPTVQESIPGFVVVAWFAMVAPPKTPTYIVQTLANSIGEILKSPEIVRRYAEIDAQPIGNSPTEMASWMKEETERWRAVIKTGEVRID